MNAEANTDYTEDGARQLAEAVQIEDGLRFAIREGGRTVGAGVVTRIVE